MNGHRIKIKIMLAIEKAKLMTRKHIIISGTGRAGTSFLVQLLTNLGLETGHTPNDVVLNEETRAGLEHDVRKEGAPYIVKSPWFCDYAEEVLKRDDILIEHVFIPIRDLHAAAESRRYVVKHTLAKFTTLQRLKYYLGKHPKIHGGLWHTKKPSKQEEVLLRQIYKLVLVLSKTAIPVTFLHYPTIVRDSFYLFRKLKQVLRGVDYNQFQSMFHKTIRPEWVHSFNKNDH